MLSDAEIDEREVDLLEVIELMRPIVQEDGGDLRLVEVDYEEGVVTVELTGACGSCALSGDTLIGGVERIVKGRLDWVTDVVGGVDNSIDYKESRAMGKGEYIPL